MADRLLVTGWDDEPRRWLTTFDLYVLPSRNEGFPLALVEAMLAGLPVVASDVGSIAEAVTTDVGYLVRADDVGALRDAIASLANDTDARTRFGAAARRRALGSFTDHAMARGYEAIYDRVLRRPE
jgi:glycosyltransferase involved in cell wall biosynthesis